MTCPLTFKTKTICCGLQNLPKHQQPFIICPVAEALAWISTAGWMWCSIQLCWVSHWFSTHLCESWAAGESKVSVGDTKAKKPEFHINLFFVFVYWRTKFSRDLSSLNYSLRHVWKQFTLPPSWPFPFLGLKEIWWPASVSYLLRVEIKILWSCHSGRYLSVEIRYKNIAFCYSWTHSPTQLSQE